MKIVLTLVMACATLAWASPVPGAQEDVEPPTYAPVPTLSSDTDTGCTCDGEGADDCTGDCADCPGAGGCDEEPLCEDCDGEECTCSDEVEAGCHSGEETPHCGGGGCH